MIGKYSTSNEQQKLAKVLRYVMGLPCEIKANLYLSILLPFHTAKSSRDCPTKYLQYSRGELAKSFILQ